MNPVLVPNSFLFLDYFAISYSQEEEDCECLLKTLL